MTTLMTAAKPPWQPEASARPSTRTPRLPEYAAHVPTRIIAVTDLPHIGAGRISRPALQGAVNNLPIRDLPGLPDPHMYDASPA